MDPCHSHVDDFDYVYQCFTICSRSDRYTNLLYPIMIYLFFLKHWGSISLDTLARRAMGEVVGLECALAELKFFSSTILPYPTLSETNRWHLKVDGWKMILSFFGFQPISRATLVLGGHPFKGLQTRGV